MIASSPEVLTMRKGTGFSGKPSLTLSPAAQQKKYMDGLWGVKELDLNPTSSFIRMGPYVSDFT